MESYELSIHQPCNSFSGFETFSSDAITLSDEREFHRVNNRCQNESNMVGILKASIMPIRTKRKDLLKDLSLPISNIALKTRSVASVSLAVISFFWDLVTLPLRLLSLIPRLVYNANKSSKAHPLRP